MRIAVKTYGFVQLTSQGKKRARKCHRDGLCMWCLKPLGESSVRHTHPSCARTIYRRIDKGRFTEKDAVVNGWWAEASPPGPKPHEPAPLEGDR